MRQDEAVKTPEAIAEKRIQEGLRFGALGRDLRALGLTSWPESLSQLTQLRRLILSGNQLTSLPDSIGQLTKLGSLLLDGNQLEALPESLGQLTQLQELALSNNKLTALPESLGQLRRLEKLDLSRNWLTVLPDSLGQLSQLRELVLSGNQLTTLPESLGQLTQLQGLHIAGNQLTTLPESLGRLTQLKKLAVAANQLTALPESLSQLTQLQELYIGENQLIALPAWIGQLTALKVLYLPENRIAALPETLRELVSLKELYLHMNEALGIPSEVLGPTYQDVFSNKLIPAKPAEILDYYSHTRWGSRPLNEAKLILVGRGAMGKTSIVNRLVYDRFEKDEKTTNGINITPWQLTLNCNENVRLNIWDFGGQEIQHSTHQFFLTKRSLYLLVLNGREGGEDADAEYWLQLIESFGGDSPVIVVLNKIKECPFDLNRRALQHKYPSIRAFVETDCADRTGLSELDAAIRQETGRLAELRANFPAIWFSIKDRLAGMKENYLSFDHYREICDQFGEHKPDDQDRLAGYLHSLGIAVNFKDDPRLKDTHVLNPRWITKGIYQILTAEKLARQKGVLYLEDLPAILNTEDYPPSKHLFLLDLMKKFDLCFEFSDEQHRYLVPELLEKQEPDLKGDFRSGQCLNFHYHYNIVPGGLLPRFIVRTHVLSARQELRWRSGVVLKLKGIGRS